MDTNKVKAGGVAAPQSLWKLNAVAAGCALACLALAGAHAQQQPEAPTQVAQAQAPASEADAKAAAEKAEKDKRDKAAAAATQTVTVTGIRRGIESAISVKRNSDSIVEAISAEDIGKLPDVSIAESIARLPGLAAQRTNGRAQQISIRGMSPDFATTLLNGREQVTTGDSRGVEYDQYPSELINAAVVYKTPDAGLVGQGLSGTVDMQTVRPLEFGRRGFAVNARKQRLGIGTVAEGRGDRFSVSFIDQFADRTLGIALGYARLSENGATTSRFESWGNGTTTYQGQEVHVPYNGFNLWSDQATQVREGAMAVLQFKPNAQFSSTLDIFHSKFDKDITHKGFQAPLNDFWAGSSQYDRPGVLTSATLSGSDVTAGTFNNVRGIVRNDAESQKDTMLSVGWNAKYKFSPQWTGTVDVNYSDAKRKGAIVETTAGTAQASANTAQLDSVQFTNAGQFTPGLNYGDRSLIKLTDVEGWGGGPATIQAGYSKLPNVKDELNAVRFSAKRDLGEGGWFSAVDFGANYTDRTKTREFIEAQLVIKGGDPFAVADIPGSGTTKVGSTGITIATFDPVAALDQIYTLNSKKHPDIYNKDWSVTEKVSTVFAKGDIDTTLFGLPVRGNAGLQIVGTDQHSTAYSVDRTDSNGSDASRPAKSITYGTTYTDVLPSMNLAADLGNSQVLRFALARVMARPTLNDMRASQSVNYDATKNIFSGGGGNPMLKPFRANAIDVSYEKYVGNKAYWGAAAFYKSLNTYIVNLTNRFDFGPFLPAGAPQLPTTLGEFTQPTNGSGGHIQGLELTASLPLNMLAPALDGFGIQASFSSTDSSVNLPTSGVTTDGIATSTIPLPGLSKRVANLTFYYENAGFSARVAQRNRSDFVGEVTNFTGDRQLTYIKGESVIDLQLGYEFQSGIAKGLSLLFQVNNLNNAEFVRYRDKPSNEIERVKYGKTYLFGLNYKL